MRPILQVDDDENDVYLFQHALSAAGVMHPIQVVTDGRQAIDYLKGAGKFGDREKYPLPCLVLLDLKLPHVMGLEVLKWIRQQLGPALIVIIMTASSAAVDIAAAYRLGANGFLIKPTAVAHLGDMAKSIKAFWLTHNVSPAAANVEAAEPETAPALTTADANLQPCGIESTENKIETSR